MKVLDKNEKLESVLPKDKFTLVKFGAEWCGPCKMIKPILTKVEDVHKDVSFISIDIDDHKELSKDLKVQGIPTLIVFRDGKEVKRTTGFQTEKQISTLIKDS